ncbi:MAG: fumarylacetoacetate hydrolase family protein [Xanthobacteraceae bacterium]|nr:fumarylacetoacetate hydrolase family protein [Xanthobacteraceae bacterium]
MPKPSPIAEAAELLRQAHETHAPCLPVRNLLPPDDVAAAYAVQEANTERRLRSGRRLIGRKIGLTSKAVQAQFGVDRPDYGMLFDDMDVPLGEEIDLRRVLQPRVEAEIAFVFGRDLDQALPTTADILRATDYVVAAVEIVGSRIANWDIRIVDTLADNASSGLFMVGHQIRRLADIDVVDCTMSLDRGGRLVSSGTGRACLGSPVSAVVWLARAMVGLGRPLRAGDVVLSGALGPMVPVAAGDVFEARIGGLGALRVAFAAGAQT